MKYRAPEIAVVTSDYHAARARYVFERELANTGVRISFLASQTDEAACQFDLDAQKKHEQQALAKLKEKDKQA